MDLVNSSGTAMIIDNVKEIGNEEMEFTIDSDRIMDINKEDKLSEASGEYTGLLRFREEES
jgi:choline kinase